MNDKYIKRQIVLHKLGVPMDEDIKEYYDFFHSLIGDVNKLKKITQNNVICWKKNEITIFEYDIKSKYFVVDYNSIWSKFEEKYRFNYYYLRDLLSILLEEKNNLISMLPTVYATL